MRASAFRSTCQAACCRRRPRTATTQPAQLLSRAVRQQQQQQRRSYASSGLEQQQQQPKEHRQMDTPNKSGNLPLLIAGASILLAGATYTISKGQPDKVKHNDHAAQAGGEFTQGREQRGSTADAQGQSNKAAGHLPGDAPNKPENLAVSEDKMQTKAPSKKTDPQA